MLAHVFVITSASAAGAQPFASLAPGFTQALYATGLPFAGGVAFAPNGDPLVAFGTLYRIDSLTTILQDGSTIHPTTTHSASLGLGLANGVDGSVYANLFGNRGVVKIDPGTGNVLAGPFGASGNQLGIALDPQTHNLVYAGADGRFYFVSRDFSTQGVFSTQAVGADGIAFDPTGNFLFTSSSGKLAVLDRNNNLVQQIALANGACCTDGIAFHSVSPQFVISNNTDGTITRYDFPGNNYAKPPTQSFLASGGFRGDLLQVGADGCAYLMQGNTRFADGTVTNSGSLVQLCPGFAPPVTRYSNALGTVVAGQPRVSYTWALGNFDYEHAVTGSEPQACFMSPGCNIDNLGAAIQWGDQSASAAGSIMCILAPYPFPPPQAEVEHCGISGTHTYSTSGTYLVTLTLSPPGPTIRSVAQIFLVPRTSQILFSIGELIGIDPNTNKIFPCSATVLHSISKNLIVTAGHCVRDLGNPTHRFTNFSFAPFHRGPTCLNLASCGENPFGVWTATSADVTVDAKFVSSDCLPSPTCGRFDLAFITVHANRTGQNVEDAVGGTSLELNGPTTGSWTAFGYPTGDAIPNSPGTYQLFFRHCSGTSLLTSNPSAPGPPGPTNLEMPCNQALTPGASGGPWLDDSTRMVGALNKGFVNNSLLGTYLSDAAGQDYLNASLPH
jgi:hypothetical protein